MKSENNTEWFYSPGAKRNLSQITGNEFKDETGRVWVFIPGIGVRLTRERLVMIDTGMNKVQS